MIVGFKFKPYSTIKPMSLRTFQDHSYPMASLSWWTINKEAPSGRFHRFYSYFYLNGFYKFSHKIYEAWSLMEFLDWIELTDLDNPFNNLLNASGFWSTCLSGNFVHTWIQWTWKYSLNFLDAVLKQRMGFSMSGYQASTRKRVLLIK